MKKVSMINFKPKCLWCKGDIIKIRYNGQFFTYKEKTKLKYCCTEHGNLYALKVKRDKLAVDKETFRPICLTCGKDILKVRGKKREDHTITGMKRMKYCNPLCKSNRPPEKIKGLEETPPRCISQGDIMAPGAKSEDLFNKILKGNVHYVG